MSIMLLIHIQHKYTLLKDLFIYTVSFKQIHEKACFCILVLFFVCRLIKNTDIHNLFTSYHMLYFINCSSILKYFLCNCVFLIIHAGYVFFRGPWIHLPIAYLLQFRSIRFSLFALEPFLDLSKIRNRVLIRERKQKPGPSKEKALFGSGSELHSWCGRQRWIQIQILV